MYIPKEIDTESNHSQVIIDSVNFKDFEHYCEIDNFKIVLIIESDDDYNNFKELIFDKKNYRHVTLSIQKKIYENLVTKYLNENFVIKNIEDVDNRILIHLFNCDGIKQSIIENNINIISKFRLKKNSDSKTLNLMYLLNDTNEIFNKIRLNELKTSKKSTEIVNHLKQIESLLKGI